jgi:putative phosphoesterase
MTILVFSDSHGHYYNLQKTVKLHLNCGTCDAVFFLGDGVPDIQELENTYPTLPIYYVYGNCEWTTSLSDAVYERVVEFAGKKFLLMHGHKYGVKSGIDRAALRGIELGCDCVLYGHTHCAEDTVYESPLGTIRVINPGALGPSPDHSYALLNIEKGRIVCGFGQGK